MKAILAAATALSVAFGASWAAADEGMWTFDNFPTQLVHQKYGVTVDQAWLDHVRGGTARIPGCSASVVSGQGLVLTNYHCVAGCAQALSTAQVDYLKDGFSAATQPEEKKCNGSWAEVLQSIQDVTLQVKAAGQGKMGQDLVRATGAAQAQMETTGCAGKSGYHCQVISFYGGGQYKLYTFRRYDDVRLVFAPEFKTGFFGGDPDNFNFPRYNLDFGLVRIYENGKPLVAPNHLRWNAGPLKAGEPVFVVGNPGGTERLLTIAQMSSQRDLSLPVALAQTAERRGRIIRFAEESPEHARISQDVIEFLENGYKVQNGREKALLDEEFFASKVADENDLRAKVAADPALKAQIGDPWADIAKAQIAYRELYLPFTFIENGGGNSQLLGWARTLVRGAQERPKPSDQRLPEYADSRLPRIERGLLAPTPVEPEMEQLNLEFWLSKAREFLTVDDPGTKLLLGRDSPETVSQRLVSGSKLGDPAVRKALWDGGLAAIQASDDPAIKLALAMEPMGRDTRNQWEARVNGPVLDAASRISKARFAVYGDKVYPDATFSPRITFGSIDGWVERGHRVPEFTTFAGLFDRATGQAPFDLPQSWFKARDRLNLATQFDFSGTLDITGGNSGSPTLNARGEVIGAVFDGNIHSLGGDYGYDPRLNRSVSVTAAAIQEALLKVYNRPDLVKELNAK